MTPEQRQEKILSNINLVYLVARSYRNITAFCYFTQEDIVSEGILGLIDAVDRYDESKGFAFSTYACSCIRGYILTYIEKNIGTFHYTRTQQEEIIRQYRMSESAEIAQINLSDYFSVLSLDDKLYSDAERTRHESVSDNNVKEEEDLQILLQDIRKVLKRFMKRDQELIQEYYQQRIQGYNKTQEEFAEIHGMTHQNLGRILRRFKTLLKYELGRR